MFGFKSASRKETTDPTTSGSSADERGVAAAPKGRATPSRKESEAARKERLKPTVDKREAARRDRESRSKQRDSMMAGDERALMPRDQGPVRRFARTYVDSRRNAAELFLPGALLILALGFVKSEAVKAASLWIWLAMVIIIAIDTVFLMRGLNKALREQMPDEDTKGNAFYSIMRALQVRPLRVPKCQVKVGGAPVTKR